MGQPGARFKWREWMAGELRLEGGEFRCSDECHQAKLLKLRVATERLRPFHPGIEFGGRRFRITSKEGARADEEVFLVLDGELQGTGDRR
jgi:hypothetical protein